MIKDLLKVFSTNLVKMFAMVLTTFFVPAALSIGEYASFKYYALIASYVGLLHFGFCDGVFVEYGGVELKSANKTTIADEQKSLLYFEVIVSLLILSAGLIMWDAIVILIGLSVIPTILFSYYTLLFQASGDFKNYSIAYNIQSLMSIVTTAILVFVIKLDSGLLYAGVSVISVAIATAIIAFKFNSIFIKNSGKFKYDLLKKYMQIGILLTIGNIAFVLFGSIDKWYVKIVLGNEAFAYYSFAVQLLSILNFVMGPVGFTLYSYMCKRREKEYEYRLKSVIMLLLFFMLGVVFIVKIIISTYLKEYLPALSLITVLFLAQVFILLNTILYVNLYKTYKMQKQYFRNLIIAIVFSLVLNHLVYSSGWESGIGYAYATLVCMIGWSILNLLDFKYLAFKPRHIVFVILMIVAYFSTERIQYELAGMCFYYLLLAVCSMTLNFDAFKILYGQVISLKSSMINRMQR